jgi:hypothetical protein
VGEIGIPRREFLYEIQFWEVRRIIRGYRRRDILKHQLLAEVVYAATFSMRDPRGKTVKDMFPSIFAEEKENVAPTLTDEDRNELQELMNAINGKSTEAK